MAHFQTHRNGMATAVSLRTTSIITQQHRRHDRHHHQQQHQHQRSRKSGSPADTLWKSAALGGVCAPPQAHFEWLVPACSPTTQTTESSTPSDPPLAAPTNLRPVPMVAASSLPLAPVKTSGGGPSHLVHSGHETITHFRPYEMRVFWADG